MVGEEGFEPRPSGPKPDALPSCAIHRVLDAVMLHNVGVCYLLLDFKQEFFINFSHFINLWLQSHKNGKCEPMHMIVHQVHILIYPIDPDQY